MLSACVGGGGGGNPDPTPTATPKVTLLPLNVSLQDLNGNALASIDVSKYYSHTWYHLTFANPNDVPVRFVPISGRYWKPDLIWVDHEAWLHHLDRSEYLINYNRGIYAVTEVQKKTDSPNDCFNLHATLAPHASCFFETLASSAPPAWSHIQSTYSYPLTYTIEQADLPQDQFNRLTVAQCKTDGLDIQHSEVYDCHNADKPGFKNQFISYATGDIHGAAPNGLSVYNNDGNVVSKDGSTVYGCQVSNIVESRVFYNKCTKSVLHYDVLQNTLTLESPPVATFTLGEGFVTRDGAPYVTPSGDTAWFVIGDIRHENYKLINSNNPSIYWGGYCNLRPEYCIPNMENSGYINAVMGLDGTFWWNPGNGEQTYNADIYDGTSNAFNATNIRGVIGVNADGTVIGSDPHGSWRDIGCWRKSGNNYQAYVKQTIQNFILPEGEYLQEWSELGNNVYAKMDMPGAVDGVGNTSSQDSQFHAYAYYKIHTENGKCEVDYDDFIWDINMIVVTSQYGYSMQSESEAYVVPLSQVDLGK